MASIANYLSGITLAGAVLIACRPVYHPPALYEVVYYFDETAETDTYSESNKAGIITGAAYSGKSSVKIDNSRAFGFSYSEHLEKISRQKIGWIRYAALFKKLSPSISRSTVVCEMKDSSGKLVLWRESEIASQLAGKSDWTKVTARFDISEAYKPGNTVKLYVWNRLSGDSLLEDDLQIGFFE